MQVSRCGWDFCCPVKEADPEAREGYMGLFCYLPVAMGSTFEQLGIECHGNAMCLSISTSHSIPSSRDKM